MSLDCKTDQISSEVRSLDDFVPSIMCLKTSARSWADLMAVFWVQQFFTLPVIFENIGMGDVPPERRLPFEATGQLGESNF